MDDRLLEPAKAYNEYYERLFEDNANGYFDDLVRASQIDAEQNRKTVQEYRHAQAKAEESDRKLRGKKALRTFLTVLAVLGFVAAVVGVVLLVKGKTLVGGIALGAGAVFGIGGIVLIFSVLNKKIKHNAEQLEKRKAKARELLELAWTQMQPLNGLFESNATKKLIEKTVPLLKIDDNFAMRRYDYLSGKYGFGDNTDETCSTIGILTGEILGNPFVVDREIVRTMGTERYTGSIVIHWTTTYTDSEGHTQTQHHSQTLTASVVKPKPFYGEQTRLIYGNEAAPDLHFSRQPTHAERMSEKELQRTVKAGEKAIRKKQDKALKNDASNFTEMGNSEFDVLFGALDRDHEVQFRLMFTPLAQKNMLTLMKDNRGYGDDFSFRKDGCLNYISSEHSANWDMDTSYERYRSYDVDESKNKFLAFNKAYFKSLYYDLAPLLSVPLYQQHKPKEYIYRDIYERNYTSYETEFAANTLGQRNFAPPAAGTPSILKTKFLRKEGKSDEVCVTAHSFRIEKQVDYVSMFGGDGRMHSVPVPWDEYIPIARESTVKVKQLPLTDRQFEARRNEDTFRGIMASFGAATFAHGLLCCMAGEGGGTFDADIENCLQPK